MEAKPWYSLPCIVFTTRPGWFEGEGRFLEGVVGVRDGLEGKEGSMERGGCSTGRSHIPFKDG